MKSDLITIDNYGNGFNVALKETRKVAAYQELNEKETIHLLLCAEEMLSMAHSITGEMQASFWIECEKKNFDLHLSTQTVMDKAKRNLLLYAATSRQNEAAHSFLGKIRDAFESAMVADVEPSSQIPDDVLADLPNHVIESLEWDGYELSVLQHVANQVKVGIRGNKVDMTVTKHFD